jgi:aryl-alcohol dehydrogenase-like predicted oxidoreductase
MRQKRNLGRSGLSIAPLVLGANVFGWTADEKTSFAVLDAFVEAGFNAIDTADVYSRWAPGNQGGESETIIGRWMKARGNRDSIVLITKVGSEMGPGLKGLASGYIARAAEASLKRLQTDRIDLYFSHWEDPTADVVDTLRGYDALVKACKVRTIGASNHTAATLTAALAASRAHGLPRYEVIQPHYNLVERSHYENALQALCLREEIGVIGYYGLASGFLTGKYRRASDAEGRERGDAVAEHMTPRGFAILDAVEREAKALSATPAQVALAWVMAQPGVTAPIASATSVDQVRDIVKAADIVLTKEALDRLSRAAAAMEA